MHLQSISRDLLFSDRQIHFVSQLEYHLPSALLLPVLPFIEFYTMNFARKQVSWAAEYGYLSALPHRAAPEVTPCFLRLPQVSAARGATCQQLVSFSHHQLHSVRADAAQELSQLPGDIYPRVIWNQQAPTARALSHLCESSKQQCPVTSTWIFHLLMRWKRKNLALIYPEMGRQSLGLSLGPKNWQEWGKKIWRGKANLPSPSRKSLSTLLQRGTQDLVNDYKTRKQNRRK